METSTIKSHASDLLGNPRIWLVIGDKPGDNAQVQIIADALGLPYEVKRVLPIEPYVLGRPKYKASLYHVDMKRSDALAPPWPDLILTIGRRPSMAALWIQEQSDGKTKIVLLGRPKRWMERFSLIIVPSQYRLPDDPRVLRLDLPLTRANDADIQTAKEEWRDHFANLPRPLTALLIGGQTEPYLFDAGVVRDLLEQTNSSLSEGYVFITTSRRTPPDVTETLKKDLPTNAKLHCWSSNNNNPYQALLGFADRFVVTSDSISMMVEVARLGKPLAIFMLPYQKGLRSRIQRFVGYLFYAEGPQNAAKRLLLGLEGILQKIGIIGYYRNLQTIHRLLFERQLAVTLGNDFLVSEKRIDDELPRVIERITKLIQSQDEMTGR